MGWVSGCKERPAVHEAFLGELPDHRFNMFQPRKKDRHNMAVLAGLPEIYRFELSAFQRTAVLNMSQEWTHHMAWGFSVLDVLGGATGTLDVGKRRELHTGDIYRYIDRQIRSELDKD